jgi:hypothetical protein
LYIIEVGLAVGFALVLSGHVPCSSALLLPASGCGGHVEFLLLVVVAWSHMRWGSDAPVSRKISSSSRQISEVDAEAKFLTGRGGKVEFHLVDMHLSTVFPLACHGGEGGRCGGASSSSIWWSSRPSSLRASFLEQGFERQVLSRLLRRCHGDGIKRALSPSCADSSAPQAALVGVQQRRPGDDGCCPASALSGRMAADEDNLQFGGFPGSLHRCSTSSRFQVVRPRRCEGGRRQGLLAGVENQASRVFSDLGASTALMLPANGRGGHQGPDCFSSFSPRVLFAFYEPLLLISRNSSAVDDYKGLVVILYLPVC